MALALLHITSSPAKMAMTATAAVLASRELIGQRTSDE
jgi:hypothetical protein